MQVFLSLLIGKLNTYFSYSRLSKDAGNEYTDYKEIQYNNMAGA